MKIMWFSNAPWYASGYGVQTKRFAYSIKDSLSHEVAITAFVGLEGSRIEFDGIPIYPRDSDSDSRIYGQNVLAPHSINAGADITITLMDSWVCEPSWYGPQIRWVPWFPIDMQPLPEIIRSKVAQSYQGITMSQFGQKMATDAGLDTRYVPHGVPTAIYKPGDREEIRERMKVPRDAFVCGMVAANMGYPSRKAFAEHLQAFAQFRRKHSDAVLMLHTNDGTRGGGRVNLAEIVTSLGLDGSVYFAGEYGIKFGLVLDTQMVDIFNTFDLFLNVSMGEGFGVPILEAQACGVPVIVGDWTSMSELCFSGWMVDKSDAFKMYQPLASYQWVARPEAIAEQLENAYAALANRHVAARKRDQAVAGAAPYDVERVTAEYWKPTLDELAERIASESKPSTAVSPLLLPTQPQKLNRAERRATNKRSK